MKTVLALWGLQHETATPLETVSGSAWRIGERHILKYNPDARQLARSIRAAGLLAAKGIPVAKYLETVNGERTAQDGTYCVMERINGIHIDLLHPDTAFGLGRGLAQLHLALASIGPELGCTDNDFSEEWQGHIKPGLADVPKKIVSEIENRLLPLYKKLPRQAIHRDVHLHNVLFDNKSISGWLDFDLTRRDVRIFDLAYLFTSLLGGKADSPSAFNGKQWKALTASLLSGYETDIPLTADEHEALPALMVAICLLFAAFYGKSGNIKGKNEAVRKAEWLYLEHCVTN